MLRRTGCHLIARFRTGDEPHAREDAECGGGFGKSEAVESEYDGKKYRYDRLHIVVHRHDGRSQIALTDGNCQVGDER